MQAWRATAAGRATSWRESTYIASWTWLTSRAKPPQFLCLVEVAHGQPHRGLGPLTALTLDFVVLDFRGRERGMYAALDEVLGARRLHVAVQLAVRGADGAALQVAHEPTHVGVRDVDAGWPGVRVDFLGAGVEVLRNLREDFLLRSDQCFNVCLRDAGGVADLLRPCTIGPLEREDLGARALVVPFLDGLDTALLVALGEQQDFLVGQALLDCEALAVQVDAGLQVDDELAAVREDRLDVDFQGREVRLDDLALRAEATHEDQFHVRLVALAQVLQVRVAGRQPRRHRAAVVQAMMDDAVRIDQRQHAGLAYRPRR
jgi:hypothetical protein